MAIGSSRLRQTVGMLLVLIFAAPSFPQSAHSQFDSYEPQFEQLNQAGRWQDLERLARQVVSLAQSGPPVDLVRADAWLIRALKAQGRFADAEAIARDAFNLSRKTAGPDAADSLNIEASLGDLLQLEHRPADAEPVLRDTLRGFEKLYGPESMPVAEMAAYLAMLLQTQRRFDEAEPLMRRAFVRSNRSCRVRIVPRPPP
jgi:tetratricopeptide (TPR) repeat protein